MRTHLLIAAAATAALGTVANAEIIYGLTTQNSIVVIDSDMPSVSLDGGFVSGLEQNETLLALDYRASDGQLFAVGSGDNLYTIDQDTFDASLVGSFSPRLTGTSFAFDFNPAFMGGEFARIISDTDNNRVISGDTGQYLAPVEKTPVFYPAGDPNAGRDPNVVGIAYTNSVPGATSTQQFGIDRNTGDLVTVANNAGTLDTVGSLGFGDPASFTNEAGFDIAGVSGTAFAALQPGPNSNLYTIDLSTGNATFQGVFGSGDIIRDLAVIPEPASAGLLAVAGLGLLRRRRA